jgi:hypothetical protein
MFRKLTWLSVAVIFSPTIAASAARPRDFLRIILIQDDDPATDDRAYALTNINATSFKNQSLTTAGDYQFTSYYDSHGKLLVARRNLAKSPKTWLFRRTEFTSYNINDSHNVSSIAIDGDGYLHIAWGVHGNPLPYSRSTTPVLNDEPMHLVGEEVGNSGAIADALPFQSGRVTYPEFFNIPGSGDLLLVYRLGSSGNGEWQLVRWNNVSNDWSAIHAASNPVDGQPQPWIDNDFTGDDHPNVNAYHNKIVFGKNGRMHVSWSWRTGPDSTSEFNDYQTNHNIMYAYSEDGGHRWRRDNGALYERNGAHDIDEDNAVPVVVIPEGSSLRNQTSSTVGPDGTYYIGTTLAPRAKNGNHLRQYMLVEYDGRRWKTHQIGQRSAEFGNQRIAETQLNQFSMRRPIVLVDEANRVLLAFSDYQRGGGVTVAYSTDVDRTDWRFLDLTTDDMGRWDPTYDLNRWQRDGVLSLLYIAGRADAETASVLEWDARSYFAAKLEDSSP